MGPLIFVCPQCGNRSRGAGLEANLTYCWCPFCKQRLNLSTGVREICPPWWWITGSNISSFFTWKRSLFLVGAVLLLSALTAVTAGLVVVISIALALCFVAFSLSDVGVYVVNEIRIFAKAENKWRAAFPFSVTALAQSEKKTGSGFMRVSEGYKRLSIVVGALTGIGFFSSLQGYRL